MPSMFDFLRRAVAPINGVSPQSAAGVGQIASDALRSVQGAQVGPAAPAGPSEADIVAALSGVPAGIQRLQDVVAGGADVNQYLGDLARDPSYLGSIEGLTGQQIAQQQQQRAQTAATNARFSSDLSWLDPTFQRQAALLGPSQAAQAQADTGAAQAQANSYGALTQAANAPWQTQSPAAQQAIADRWGQVAGGQGAPTFTGDARQADILARTLGVAPPQFQGDATQRALLGQITGQTGQPNAGLTFDTSGRQAEQYGNLQGIIAGGGADTLEMARRQRQRADQESWLRGQREADLQNLSERGMSGSGAELLALNTANQAAAGRNSLADLETAAALEQRRMDAINSAAGLAGTMRGQTIDEQSLLNNARLSNWNAAASLANNMRGADYNEQMGLNAAQLAQLEQAGGLAGTMRGQGFQEQSYLDKRALDALVQQGQLTTQMRDQLLEEQQAQRSTQMQGLLGAANVANQARSQTWDENFGRASAADQFAQLNQSAINSASSQNQAFLQQSYQQMQQQRQQAALQTLQMKVNAGMQLTAADMEETMGAFRMGQNIAGQTANQTTNAQGNYNNVITGQGQVGAQNNLAATAGQNAAQTQTMGWFGDVMDEIISQGTGGMGGKGGAAVGAKQPTFGPGGPTDPFNDAPDDEEQW